ncbi:MAG: putative selenate reductase subunit YgfK [Ignavibacteriaceae bacterium]|nr:putative selenate reductase subunit YgfK [Ignavibacteriaceae bacterium]
MSDTFYRIPLERLLSWILQEEKEGMIFGIYKENLFTTNKNDPFRIRRYGQLLETPIGVAAGPHTQLAHNIVASWLCGARYIELKTVQTLDNIEVTKPCIDMEDEGYNCEWSQELRIQDSFDEYLNAWILIHLLKHKFGWDLDESGFIFNLSVGYDVNGILNENVQWFFNKMNDCKDELDKKIEILKKFYPSISEIKIPSKLSDNITLSTMHGCPSDEIEKIGKYLIEERNLHTAIKLNPTLLGSDELQAILNEKLGYEITVPEEAFEHDLKYPEAIEMINSLNKTSAKNGVEFGLKLTNTLESLNSTHWLPKDEKMVYTSGRALHPLTVNLAKKLQTDFDGKLDISFSAGVDTFNVADTLACNLKPITVCSDLLKPGGYLRLPQYFDELKKHFKEVCANSIDEFISNRSNSKKNINESGLNNLNNYADSVLENKYYHKSNFPFENIKTDRELTAYDCIHAPCIEACAVDQNVPEYMYQVSNGNLQKAYEAVTEDNPQPNITGNVCDHLCQPKCTRINYDKPLLIRGIKRYISENAGIKTKSNGKKKNGLKAAVIGGGPSGLSCAYFLSLEGFDVNVFESKSFAGGMASGSIPKFRLSDDQIKSDIDLIESVGAKIHYNQNVDEKIYHQLKKENDVVYIAVGAKKSKKLKIEGEDLPGVYDQLSFLFKVRSGEKFKLGNDVAIIGGGLSAVDAARTANRIVNGKVTMIYRRTKKEMPVGADEIKALLEEGVKLIQLATPVSILKDDKDQLELNCIKMKLGKQDKSGRRRPVPIKNSNFQLKFDSIITAIGQDIFLDFLPNEKLKINSTTFETQFKNVFAGGDVVRGADSLINAIGDGRSAALKIIEKSKIDFHKKTESGIKLTLADFQKKQAYRKFGIELPETELTNRKSFELVNPVLTDEQARKEAERCIYCDDICNICVGVCPNFANFAFESEKMSIPIYKISTSGSGKKSEVIDRFVAQQTNQILNVADFCNECGNCVTFCPTNGSPFEIKPRFYLTEESFNKEDFGYLISQNQIKYKSKLGVEFLSLNKNLLIYENDIVIVNFDKNNFDLIDLKFKSEYLNEIVLKKAAEMYYLFKNLNYHTLLV